MDFATSLVIQAKLHAFRRGAEEVLGNDVDEALGTITRERTQTWKPQFATMLGGALLGTFLQGFAIELPKVNAPLVVLYTVFGLLGMFSAFWGLRR
jgi:hypothetical protein